MVTPTKSEQKPHGMAKRALELMEFSDSSHLLGAAVEFGEYLNENCLLISKSADDNEHRHLMRDDTVWFGNWEESAGQVTQTLTQCYDPEIIQELKDQLASAA